MLNVKHTQKNPSSVQLYFYTFFPLRMKEQIWAKYITNGNLQTCWQESRVIHVEMTLSIN